MPKNNDENFVCDDDDREDPVAIRDDDEEANEDLSLQILEKPLSRRDFDDSKESSMSDLCTSSGVVGTVIVNGGTSKGNKKMKRTKLQATNEISIVEDIMVEDVVKGEEDDEVERSAVTKPGETSSNMVLKKLLRGARYFDPPDAGWVSCYSCGEQGHITVNCPTPTKRRKPCFICGSLEHGAKQCSKGQDCYICKKGGHRAKDCPDKYKSGSKTAVCLRCGDFGHDMILCKYEYSQDDLKDIQCYVCKSFGHLCCVEPGNSPSWAVSCYRCGQLGHIGLACGRHYEESTENNSASLCFRCGEEGHFSRECPNSSSISTSQGRESPSICYSCDGAGHFARECPNSSVSKRNRETSTPSHRSRKKNRENSEHESTPHETNWMAKKKDKENSEQNSTPHETNGKTKKKDKENSEQNSTPHETNGKAKKKDKENSEQTSTPHESNGKAKKKDKGNSEQKSTPQESNGKSKKKKKKKTHRGEQSQTTPQNPKQRGGWITEDPRSPITPSGPNHHRLPITPPGQDHHRYHTRYQNHRSQTFNAGGHFPGSQSTTPYGRYHRNSSLDSSGHFPGPPPSRRQPYHPPSYQQYGNAPPYHPSHQQNRYSPRPPSSYGPAHQYREFAGNYER